MTHLSVVVDNTVPPEDSPYREYLKWERRKLWKGILWGLGLTLAVVFGIAKIAGV